jgi:hypothetical protein
MSGFRKFRSTLHRRRRSIEAAELGYLVAGGAEEGAPRPDAVTAAAGHLQPPAEPEAVPLDFSPSREAQEIGPNPIAWLKSKRTQSDN